jgi:uncharacterized protein YjbI with pentapeptide repeats/WD40 repeat protein
MRERKARVAVVQLAGRLAFEAPGHDFLSEPLDLCVLGELRERLPPESSLIEVLTRLQHNTTRAYCDALLPKLAAVVEFCGALEVDLVVFSEYVIPGQLLPQLVALAQAARCTLVAGTHLVTTQLLRDPAYRACFGEAPPANRSIAPFVKPDGRVEYQDKLWRSQWETVLDTGAAIRPCEVPLRQGDSMTVGVAICIDFLRHRDDAAADKFRGLYDCDLIAVPSYTSKDTAPLFAHSADDIYRHFHRPVAYANHSSLGGTNVFCFGAGDGRSLLPGSRLSPMPAESEAVCVVDLSLEHPAATRPNTYLSHIPSELITYSLILHEAADRQLASVAHALLAAADVAAFHDERERQQAELALACRRYTAVQQVAQRWRILAKGAQGEHGLARLRMLARDVWLPDRVSQPDDIERQLALGVLHTLRQIVERTGIDADERTAAERARDELQRACSQRGWTIEPDPKDRIVAAVKATLFEEAVPALARPAIDANGEVDPWAEAAPSPANLDRRGFRLWPARALLTARASTVAAGAWERDLGSLIGARVDLETAATFLALRCACPAWVGWSPGGVPVLVVPPYHVVFVTPVIPDATDLREARTVAGHLLPVVLLTGEGSQIARTLDLDIVPLNRAIQRLATLAPRLRELSDFAYTPVGLRFVDPACRTSGKVLPGLVALDLCFGAKTTLLRGRLFDGRTTLVRAWLARLARQALISDGAPVFYHDCAQSAGFGFHDLLAGLEPAERAALRLAIRSGNCLLVLDGLDDRRVREARIRLLPHVSDASRIMLVTCQQEPPVGATVVELLSAGAQEQSALLRHYGPKDTPADGTPRGFIALPQGESSEPPAEALERYIEGHARLLDPTNSEAFIRSLEHLAFAMWTAFPRPHTRSAGWVPKERLVRTHAERSGLDGDWPRLDALNTIAQPLVASAETDPQRGDASQMHDWLSMQLAMRGSLVRDYPFGPSGEPPILYTLAWAPAAQYLLARHIVRALADGDATALDILPLYGPALRHAVRLPNWQHAQARLVDLLCAGLSPTRAANALLLVSADPSVGSTRELPWKLPGADLRAVHIGRLRLAHADLTGARLCGCYLRESLFCGADLTGADLHDCDLTGADFTDAVAVNADFSGAELDGAIFRGAVLRGADFSRTRAATTAPDLAGAVMDSLRTVDVAWPSGQTDASTIAYDELTPAPPPQRQVLALAWSPDGHRLAVGYASGLVELWSAGLLRCIMRWRDRPSPVRALSFSPAGDRLAVAGDDNPAVSVWNLANLSLAVALPHPAPPITGLWWEDGDTLWTFSEHPRRWRLADGALLEVLTWVPRCFEGQLIDDGRTLITVAGSANPNHPHRHPQLTVHDRASQRVMAEHAGGVLGLSALSPDGRSLIVVSDRKAMLRAINEPTATPARELLHPRFQTHSFGVLPRAGWTHDGTLFLFLSGHELGTVACIDTREFALRSFPLPFAARAEALLVSPRGRRIALLLEGVVRLLDLDTTFSHSPQLPLPAEQSPQHIEWTPRGLRLQGRQFVENLDLEAGISISHSRQFEHDPGDHARGEDAAGRQRVYQRDGVFVVECDQRRRMIVLDEAPTPPVHAQYDGSPSWWFTPDGEHVLIQQPHRENEQRTDVWCTRTGRHRLHFLAPDGGAFVVLNGDETLVFGGQPGALILYDARRARLRVNFHSSIRFCAAPDPRELVGVDSHHGTVFRPDLAMLCDRVRAQPVDSRQDLSLDDLPCLWRHEAAKGATHCMFSGARDLVAVSAWGVLELRRRGDGELLGTLSTGLAQGPAAFSPDGCYLACCSDAWVQLWRVDGCELAATIFRDRSGALFLVGSHYQLLRDPNEPLPGINGFYGRRGAKLTPLSAADGLARNDLLATFLRSLRNPTADL